MFVPFSSVLCEFNCFLIPNTTFLLLYCHLVVIISTAYAVLVGSVVYYHQGANITLKLMCTKHFLEVKLYTSYYTSSGSSI